MKLTGIAELERLEKVSQQHPLFNAIRVAVSRYNKRTSSNWKASVVAPERMQVWEDKAGAKPKSPEQTVPAEKSPIAVKPPTPVDERPSKFEFCSYLQSMAVGTEFALPESMSHRFEDLTDWVLETEDALHLGLEHDYNAITKELIVRRKANNG